jgi:hypothetical protein
VQQSKEKKKGGGILQIFIHFDNGDKEWQDVPSKCVTPSISPPNPLIHPSSSSLLSSSPPTLLHLCRTHTTTNHYTT